MDEQLKKLLEKTLIATQPLVEAAQVADSKLLNVLVGIYRISFTTLRDIDHLASGELTGPSILDLTRKIIEHGITIEYMLWKGKEETAEKFQNYLTVQMHEELELLKTMGQDPTALSDQLKIGIEETEKEYAALSKSTKDRTSWAGIKFEEMVRLLKEAGTFKEDDSPRLLAAYVWGCRSNHPNPFMTYAYLDLEELKVANTFSSRLGIAMSLAVHIRLTTRLIDESSLAVGSDIHPEIAKSASKIFDELNQVK